MSNYIEYNDKIAFHPGYYIKEFVEESGLTQADFAKKLDTTPKNLSVLISGEQSLSIDIATKLSRMLGTSVKYWLNLQQTYDAMKAEYVSEELLQEEKVVFKLMDYDFYIEKYSLPREEFKETRIKRLREYLKVSTLKVLKEEDLSVSFRGYKEHLTEADIINSNAFVQVAMNTAMKESTPKYNKKRFEETIAYFVKNHVNSMGEIKNILGEAGVRFLLLPCVDKPEIDAVSKKIDGRVLLVINDKRIKQEDFWRILFQELWHIGKNEYGISFKNNNCQIEKKASEYAQRMIENKLSLVVG